MKIRTSPKEIFDEYQAGKEYNQSLDLYDNVEKNRRFYHGDQWYGVKAPDMTKPVFNIIKRVSTYYAAMLVSDDVGVHIRPFNEDEQNKAMAEIVSSSVEACIERTKTKQKARTNIKDACVDGDTAVYVRFDPDIETGNQSVSGDIATEIIDNEHVIFGNPYSDDVQRQPYILIVQRLYTAEVKDQAKEYGLSDDDIAKIIPDEDDNIVEEDSSNNKKLTTVITKFWKVKGTKTIRDPKVPNMTKEVNNTSLHFTMVTSQVTLRKDTDTGQKLYPIAWFSWDKVKNSYHGRSPITGLIPNQVFINKIYAMCMVYMTNMGFPKVFYDQNKIAKLTNNVTSATAITNMDLAGKMIDAVKAPDFSTQIMSLVDSTIAYTKDFMGASDAALGNISNPNNTSAIVAVQQASSVPLELQRLDYYQFFEDIVRIMVDVISCRYGTRTVRVTESQAKALNLIDHYKYVNVLTGQEEPPMVDHLTGQISIPNGVIQQPVYKTYTDINFSALRNLNYDIDVEIGQSSYWSEATTVQTLDNMYDKGIITNPVTYLEGIPDKYVPNKQQIIDEIKQQQNQANIQQQAAQAAAMAASSASTEAPDATYRMQDGVDNRGSDNPALQEAYAQSKEYYNPDLNDSVPKTGAQS